MAAWRLLDVRLVDELVAPGAPPTGDRHLPGDDHGHPQDVQQILPGLRPLPPRLYLHLLRPATEPGTPTGLGNNVIPRACRGGGLKIGKMFDVTH